MVICYVKNCKSRSSKGSTVRFFCMPKKQSVVDEWLKLCRPDTDQKTDARVCSKHFLPSDYYSKSRRKHLTINETRPKYARLKEDAVPSLELDGDTESRPPEESSITRIENGYLKNKVKVLENKLIKLAGKEKYDQHDQKKRKVAQKIIKECCVPNCGSNELNTEKSGITYYEFPKDSQTRSQWIQGLQLGDWRPNANSVVCSLHFSDEEFVQTELQALEDAPGTSETKTELNIKELAESNLCRICLSSDRKVDHIREDDIAQQYELLTASKDCLGDVLPQYICWECKARLASFARLHSVAMRSLEILQEYYENHNRQETTKDIQFIIDRDKNAEAFTSNPKNKNDNYKSTNMKNDNSEKHRKLPKALKKGMKRTKAENENDNDNSDSNNVNDNLIIPKVYHVPMNKKKKSTIENENDNSENDNFDYSEDDFEDETASQKSDNSNSELDDIIYDSDSSKSDLDIIINRKIDLHIAKINCMFDDEKLSLISRGINTDCIQIKKSKNVITNVYEDFEHMFSIKHLTKEEQLKEFLLRRESNNYNYAMFKCDVCYRGFLRERAFELHQLKHTDAYGPAKCSLCGIHFRRAKLMWQHLRVTHQNRYICKHCDYVTGALQKAKEHMLYHKGTIFKCGQCDKTFKTMICLQCHFRKKHSCDAVCHLCGKSFVSEKGLRTHKLMVHPLDSPEIPEDGPRCVECNIQFSTDAALTTHYQESNKHKHLHSDDKSRKRKAPGVICELCGMQLQNFLKYHWHFKSHHPDKARAQYPFSESPVMCDVCSLVCPNQARLRMHKDTHSDIKKYSCKECSLRFKTMQALYKHRDTHKGKVHACDICGKKYLFPSTLARHKIIHQNRKFDCNICGKSFSHPHNRHNHITYVHNKKPLPVRKNRVKLNHKGKILDRIITVKSEN